MVGNAPVGGKDILDLTHTSSLRGINLFILVDVERFNCSTARRTMLLFVLGDLLSIVEKPFVEWRRFFSFPDLFDAAFLPEMANAGDAQRLGAMCVTASTIPTFGDLRGVHVGKRVYCDDERRLRDDIFAWYLGGNFGLAKVKCTTTQHTDQSTNNIRRKLKTEVKTRRHLGRTYIYGMRRRRNNRACASPSSFIVL